MQYAGVEAPAAGVMMDIFEMRRQVSEAQLSSLVSRFYDRVQDDAQLGPVFASQIETGAWPVHLARMQTFWSTVLLGTGSYRGNPMMAHQAIAGIERAHFGRWLALFEVVVRDVFSDEKVAEAILKRAQRMGVSLMATLNV